jgi:hypothetical protein
MVQDSNLYEIALLNLVAASDGGARRDRTDDLMLAKHALSQLSYGPEGFRLIDRTFGVTP